MVEVAAQPGKLLRDVALVGEHHELLFQPSRIELDGRGFEQSSEALAQPRALGFDQGRGTLADLA